MGDSLDTSLDMINTSRAEVGLEPLVGFGFPKLSVSFLREKAEQQLRDALGRWVKQRGSTDLEPDEEHGPKRLDVDPRATTRAGRSSFAREPRADIGKPIINDEPYIVDSAPTWNPRGPSSAQAWGQGPPPPPKVNTAPLRIMSGDEAEAALVAVGEDPLAAEYRAKAGYVFTRDGKHFVYTPSRKHAVAKMLMLLHDDSSTTRAAAKKLIDKQKEILDSGKVPPVDMMQQANSLVQAVLAIEQRVVRLESIYQSMPDNERPGMEQVSMAAAALDEYEAATQRIPGWRQTHDGKDVPVARFTIDLDETQFEPGSGTAGFTRIGFNGMVVNPEYFSEKPEDVFSPGHLMPTGFEVVGRYTINHELGHMSDQHGAWGSVTRPDVWQAAKDTGLFSEYGKTNVYEGYAEAFAMWMSGQKDHPVAKLYAEAFQWDNPGRAAAPDVASIPGYVEPFTGLELRSYAAFKAFAESRPDNAEYTLMYRTLVSAFEAGDIMRVRQILSDIAVKIPGIFPRGGYGFF